VDYTEGRDFCTNSMLAITITFDKVCSIKPIIISRLPLVMSDTVALVNK
jgi:hypothetical protein